ncbi:uncharacterized protein J3R85_004570 [Psidium guajava]|nr:uncharacterized protein J3R85_004570 [Psidium guajava]
MYDENSFPEKNSPVNLIITLPPPTDSSSALENSTAQPCTESNPLPEKEYSKRKKKQREKRLKRKEARNNSAGVPYAVLQTIKEKRQKIKEKRKKRRIKRRVQEREAKAREKVSGKSNLLGDIPNNVSQVADLDESVMKEFSSTFSKQSDIEREEVHGEAHTKVTSFHSHDARFSHLLLLDGKPEQVEERIQATSAQAPMGIFDFFLGLSRIGPSTIDMEDKEVVD